MSPIECLIGAEISKKNNGDMKSMVYRNVCEMQKQRKIQELRCAEKNEHMVFETSMKWHERTNAQISE